MAMNPGKRNRYVTLDQGPTESDDSDGMWEPLDPPGDWVAISPGPPAAEGRSLFHTVTMRYRSDVTVDTRLTLDDRYLVVRGIQHVDEAGIELVLLCEEAM